VYKNWDARFGGTDGDELGSIQQTSDGGYVLAGTSTSGISGNKTQSNWDASQNTADYWIVKIDANGNYKWDKRYGGTSDDFLESISPTQDGGVILGGFSDSDSSGDKTQNSQGQFDYWVVKVDSLGNKQWDKRFGGSNNDILDKIIQTRDGGYILAGFSESGISGDKTQPDWDISEVTSDYWVVKIDSVGNKQWDKRFGGTSNEEDRDIIQTPDGGYLIGGTSVSDTGGDKTQPNFANLTDNFWVIKIDSLGNKQWDKVYGGTSGEEFGNSINIPKGGYMLGGSSYDGISGDKTSDLAGYWLVQIDSSGDKLGDWAFGTNIVQPGGFAEEQTFGGMVQTNDGGYLLTGTSGSVIGNDKTENNLSSGQVWTIKIDSLMNRVWDKTSLTLYTNANYDQSAGALESSNGCYLIGVATFAGIGGDKTQSNWDATDATDDYWVVEYCDSFPLGIQEPEGTMHLLVYPNPTSGDLYINIQKDNLTEASFTLTSTTGQTIYQSTADHLAHSYTKILDLSKLPTGVYLLDVIVDGERIVKKVLKE
jgi:hypothetical protein